MATSALSREHSSTLLPCTARVALGGPGKASVSRQRGEAAQLLGISENRSMTRADKRPAASPSALQAMSQLAAAPTQQRAAQFLREHGVEQWLCTAQPEALLLPAQSLAWPWPNHEAGQEPDQHP